ncbi:class II aldolase/adducin domain-containing protein [Leucosporidium creatinivorum]|uniref:Class II aldolase/adducin domain-containing protein n=1 Tax=Leucosporidium creatinivorum TaxID=106004 RepID=A0A1Y2G2Y5_9BASI|nr:class II aldolase/adducin domain-containing protein [Leucosporidium creatinivorum]
MSTDPTVQPDAIPFDFGADPPTFTDPYEERKYIKERLALAYRVFAKLGLVEGASGHLTVRDPVRRDCFWVTPFGKQFALMTASDLLLIDHDGKVCDGGKPGKRFYNTAAFIIHAKVHAERPNANAVCHSHSPYGKAFSVLRKPLPLYTQDSCIFYNDCGLYNQFGGVVLDMSESSRIANALGDKKALIMASHGLLTVGESIESATAWFIALENECKTAILAESAAAFKGNHIEEIDDAAAKFTYDTSGFEKAGWFESQPWFDLVEEECGAAHKA